MAKRGRPKGSKTKPRAKKWAYPKQVGPRARPLVECDACETDTWWQRPFAVGGGWACGVCSPKPAHYPDVPDPTGDMVQPARKREVQFARTWQDVSLKPRPGDKRCSYCEWGMAVVGKSDRDMLNRAAKVRAFCWYHYWEYIPSDPFQVPWLQQAVTLWRSLHRDNLFGTDA